MPILYCIGDATEPESDQPIVIVHVCNDIGAWGRGFVLALSRHYPQAEARYRAWSKGKEDLPFVLGQAQFVEVAPRLWVANLIGQHGIGRRGGVVPVRYEAIAEGLERVAAFALSENAVVQMPRIGSGLAGGKWEIVAPLIESKLIDKGIAVTVYDLVAAE